MKIMSVGSPPEHWSGAAVRPSAPRSGPSLERFPKPKPDSGKPTICPGSKIHSDALGSFRAALREGYDHHFQVFNQRQRALRWVHTLISNAKSFLLGTYHGLGKKHLQSYFDEFAFRFNRRFWPEQLFPRLVCAVVASNILGYDDLTR